MQAKIILSAFFLAAGMFKGSLLPPLSAQALSTPPPSFQQQAAKRFFNLGLRLFNSKSYEAAVGYFISALQQAPGRTELSERIRYFLGRSFYQAGEVDNAANEWQNLMRLHGYDPLLQNKLTALRGRSSFAAAKRADNLNFRLPGRYVKVASYPPPRPAGSRQYEVVAPTGVYVDRQERLYVLDFSLPRLAVLNGNGGWLGSLFPLLNKENPLSPLFQSPGALLPFYDPPQSKQLAGFYISDFNLDRVVLLSLAGEQLASLGKRGITSAVGEVPHWLGPRGMAPAPGGNLYVVDTGNARVMVVNPRSVPQEEGEAMSTEGRLLASLGGRGPQDGKFLLPTAVAYAPVRNRLFVADKQKRLVQQFDVFENDFTYLSKFGAGLLSGPEQLIFPPATEPGGKSDFLLIVDRSQVYSHHLDTKQTVPLLAPEDQSTASSLATPHYRALAFDPLGLLYLADEGNRTVALFSPPELLYQNLFLQVERILSGAFPKVRVEVSVQLPNQRPLVGLEAGNFKVFENGVLLPHTQVVPAATKRRRFVVLLERSLAARAFKENTVQFLRRLYQQLAPAEVAKLLAYGGNTPSEAGRFEALTVFSPLSQRALKQAVAAPYYPYVSPEGAFRQAVNLGLGNDEKAILVWLVYEAHTTPTALFGAKAGVAEGLLAYAKHNQIPLYVVYLGAEAALGAAGQSRFALLRKVAEATGGAFFSYSESAADRLLTESALYERGHYYLDYSTVPNRLARGLFRSVTVTAQYKIFQGEDNRAGYVLP